MFTDHEIECFRIEEFEKWEADADELKIDWKEFAPGTYGAHEALQVASVFSAMVSDHLVSHKAIVIDPEFYRLAYRACEALNELYQAIGAKHLMAIPDKGET